MQFYCCKAIVVDCASSYITCNATALKKASTRMFCLTSLQFKKCHALATAICM